VQKDAYTLILEAIEAGVYKPGDRLVESELAERLGVSRTPVREALQRLETQAMLTRDGRSLIVASLDHNQLAELYTVRTELEGLAARLAARHATPEEVRVLRAWWPRTGRCWAAIRGAEPGQQAVSQADPSGQPQPLSGAAAGPGASVDGADGEHVLCRRGARRGGAGRT
jgi:DNA-binding FadR family transcriptional regulator